MYGIRKKIAYAFVCVYQLQKAFGFYTDLQNSPTEKTKRSRKRKPLEITRKAKLLGQSAEVLSFQIMMKRAEECHTLTNVSREDKKAKQWRNSPASRFFLPSTFTAWWTSFQQERSCSLRHCLQRRSICQPVQLKRYQVYALLPFWHCQKKPLWPLVLNTFTIEISSVDRAVAHFKDHKFTVQNITSAFSYEANLFLLPLWCN